MAVVKIRLCLHKIQIPKPITVKLGLGLIDYIHKTNM